MRRTAFLPTRLANPLLWGAPGRAAYLWIDPAQENGAVEIDGKRHEEVRHSPRSVTVGEP
ncbi:hypothetical protein [Azovibrio restrictus]|uniref:hypothetical protein n=1 Tax=Azovibrio restrictus TaxID=146938 RepID=UPI0026EE6B3F|nr:hypothetical protein [Azovibrio restrictus]MDD3483975.1 hypothetical protein [Azovibrio restrictus]